MLRDYQIEMLDRLERAWQGHRSVLVQMPTGTGKTVLLAEVVRDQMKLVDAPSVLIVAHRRELIEQIRNTLKRYGLDGANVVVESIQKLSSPNIFYFI